MCGRIIIVKKKRRIAIRHPTEVRGDVITNNNIMLFSKISYSDLQLIFEFILCFETSMRKLTLQIFFGGGGGLF
jgi:hypothetical protein